MAKGKHVRMSYFRMLVVFVRVQIRNRLYPSLSD
jgi:hypothetical protein